MIPIMIWQLMDRRAEEHQVAWFVAGLFVLVAVPMSVHDGTSSLRERLPHAGTNRTATVGGGCIVHTGCHWWCHDGGSLVLPLSLAGWPQLPVTWSATASRTSSGTLFEYC